MSNIEPTPPDSHFFTTNNVPSDAPRTFRRKSMRSSIEVVAKAARVALGLPNDERGRIV